MHRRTLLPGLAALPLLPRAAAAQGWNPDRPLRMLVGFAAGGSTDTTARIVAQAITPALGQQVLVENRTGAGGNSGDRGGGPCRAGRLHAGHGLDGHPCTVNQSLYRSLPFHVARDFSAVSLVALSHSLLVVHPSVQARSVTELIALARTKPGGLNAGTGGLGSSQHFAAVLFEHETGVRFTQVHYRGGAPAMADLVSGRVDLIFAPVVESIQQVRAGQVRALGITRKERAPQLAEVPAITEQVPGFVFTSWLGVFAPAGTPAPAVARLSEAIQAAMRVPAMRDRMAELGYDAVGSTAEEFADFQRSEITRTAELVRISGATVE
ncbi:Bug family tripartite tricarboxylate transporter substrate binding protein [Dankookia sp. P2]|uniref:Bug family tripartite tricarboxylate transporter substrate binding protein n=1 Tax=Dankookia sp. P2 TaxID=3423955 RepID=UPI003D6650E6